jgi:hypothetical protein
VQALYHKAVPLPLLFFPQRLPPRSQVCFVGGEQDAECSNGAAIMIAECDSHNLVDDAGPALARHRPILADGPAE